jgi:MFS family permease
MSSDVSLKQIAPAVYGPTLLFSIGQGAVLPVVALSARELGAGVGTASLVVALLGIGKIIGNVPGGALSQRVGERWAMVIATGLTVPALAGCILAPSVWALALAITLAGLSSAVWGLARQSYLTEAVPLHMRARALSTLGGTHRIGTFIGPFAGAAVTGWGGVDAAYGLHLVAALGAVGLLLALPEVDPHAPTADRTAPARPKLTDVLKEHAQVLRTLGVACLFVQAARQARQSVLPLWAEAVGLDVAQTSLVFGVAGAVDMLLFYPAGSVMDRFGRAWVGVPSTVVLGVAHLLLPLTSTLWEVGAVAVLMGIGNGIGSGLVMTLGADVSPAAGRPVFLGAWRLVTDTGVAVGPLVVSAAAAVATLGVASLTVGGIAFVGAAALARWVPRRSVRAYPR